MAGTNPCPATAPIVIITDASPKNRIPAKQTRTICVLRFYFPQHLLFTKKGEISKRSFDLTNIEKLLQDNLFESRYNGREIDGVVIENFDIDDKFIVDLHSRKLPHEKDYHEIRITVALIPLSYI